LFTGQGISPCGGADCALESSALRALKSQAKFQRYAFSTPRRSIAADLKNLIVPLENAGRVDIIIGDPNREKALRQLLDSLPRSASGLVFIDPHGYRKLKWSTLEKLAQHARNWQNQKVDLLIIFPIEMALLRNLTRRECADSLTAFFGNRLWEDIRRQMQMPKKTSPDDIKYKLVEIYKDGLRNLGYRYVEDFKPASPAPSPYYHLIYAGDTQSRKQGMKDAWGKTRFLRCELLYRAKEK
jgi:three-Cys-motif partner protein